MSKPTRRCRAGRLAEKMSSLNFRVDGSPGWARDTRDQSGLGLCVFPTYSLVSVSGAILLGGCVDGCGKRRGSHVAVGGVPLICTYDRERLNGFERASETPVLLYALAVPSSRRASV